MDLTPSPDVTGWLSKNRLELLCAGALLYTYLKLSPHEEPKDVQLQELLEPHLLSSAQWPLPLSLIKWETPGSLKPPHQAHQAVLERVVLLPHLCRIPRKTAKSCVRYVPFEERREGPATRGPSREGVCF